VVVAEVFIGPDNDILIDRVVAFIVRSSRKLVCSIGSPRFVFQNDIVLFSFWEVSSDSRSDFSGVPIVSQVGMIGEDKNRDMSALKEV
jgi:hypothetical protein